MLRVLAAAPGTASVKALALSTAVIMLYCCDGCIPFQDAPGFDAQGRPAGGSMSLQNVRPGQSPNDRGVLLQITAIVMQTREGAAAVALLPSYVLAQ